MPVYEYRCTTCDTRFEIRRPAAEAGAPATCPDGHEGARRVLSVFATAGRSAPAAAPTTGGGCGAGCACAH